MVRLNFIIIFLIFTFMIAPQFANAMELKEKKILFIHHSTGGNLIKEGKLRETVKKLDPSIQLWDHNYNYIPFIAYFTHYRGLTDYNGNITGNDYNIVLSNNSPKEFAEIFSRDPNDYTLRSILSYNLIAFKNCYPTTKIISDQQLEEDISYYKVVASNLKRYPKKQFVFLTSPPMRKEMTNIENAKRAKSLTDWLNSEFARGVANVHVFDLFGLLSDNNGFLKNEYTRFFPWDSHPNRLANETISPIFADYLKSRLE